MPPIDETTISAVLDVYGPERSELLDLLDGLDADQWQLPTECPAYSVKGIASHVLGDDLSLLSRQRDDATPGLVVFAEHHAGLDFRGLLDGFNDQWVEASAYFSPRLLVELLRLAGTWTETFYRTVDPAAPGEPVPLYSPPPGETSPFWQAIAREFLERWAHHSQIRRALGRPSLAEPPFLETGARIIAAVAGADADVPADGDVGIGPLGLGDRDQAAAILTLAHTEAEVRDLVRGPDDLVAAFAARVGRRASE